jgi:hypothetical protein
VPLRADLDQRDAGARPPKHVGAWIKSRKFRRKSIANLGDRRLRKADVGFRSDANFPTGLVS